MADPQEQPASDNFDPDLPTQQEDDGTETLPNGDTIVRNALGQEEDDTENEALDHFANIVDDVDQAKLAPIVIDLIDLIEKDEESYKKRDKKNAEALQRTGLGDDAPGGATFAGASRVVHPGLMEAAIDGSARIIKEIFPSGGPVREKITGDVTPDKFKKAERKQRYMNWQCTTQIRSMRAEIEQMLPQACLSGVAYLQVFYNERLKRPDVSWIPGDEMRLPFAATNYYTAERKTRVEDITEFEFESRVKSGMYVDIENMVTVEEPTQSDTQKASDKIQGKSATAYNEDGLRRIYRVNCWLDLEADSEFLGEPEDDDEQDEDAGRVGAAPLRDAETDEPLTSFKPYILSIDLFTRQAVALYRNWEEDDDKYQDLNWVIEFPFVPWRGAYPVGLIHMIGGLSAATTGALRALLDSAHINNMPTALKLKGGDKGGQTQQLNPTQVNEVEGSLQTDDIRKTWMSLPFNPPSPVLFQLLGFLVEASNGVVRTTFEDLASNSTQMPVGTVQALIEQGMVVFSAIHGRMHDAMGRVLEALHLVNKLYLTDEEVVEELGDLVVSREDFEGPMDVVPVSDPNVFSEVQRTAQMQMVVQRSDQHPELYNQLEVEKMLLKRTKIPDAEKLLREPPKPAELNAVNENLAMTLGRPVSVFPDQDHMAHLNTLIQYAISPVFGMNPIIAANFLPAALAHARDHLAYWYVDTLVETASKATGRPIAEFISKDADVSKALDDLLAIASASTMQEAQKLFEKLPAVIAQLRQEAQKYQMPQAQDPTAVAAQQVQAQRQTEQERNQIAAQGQQQKAQEATAEQQRLAAESQADQAESAADRQSREQIAAQASEVKIAANQADNATAEHIATLNAVIGHDKTNLKDGTGINPGV